ncbi:Diacylglycerol O-acyltransferase [Frankia torreyi]|uniref:diacylglycerol O-acyltransferase n=2 Tax=Frankia TaxID=1854 RepID=A0A0D8BAA1_9ACTN|nr:MULTISPECIES: wax ester/triacylglycerol synthase domain-containing protein [Frankia]KJE21121.1 Diacylglycerol O-acyltransferase [Frankia torreyi]KQM03210.1 Diacylglycerol O-acyltransferase [Frankia sp. CpI1-P]
MHDRSLTMGDHAFLAFTRRFPGEFLDIGVLLYVGGPPLDLAGLRAHVADRLRAAPRLTERLQSVASPAQDSHGRGAKAEQASPRWASRGDVNVDDHVVVTAVPEGSGDEGLRRTIDRLATRPVDLGRPPWMLHLLRGHSVPGTLVLYRASHVHQDGGALYRALHLLFGEGDETALALPPAFPVPRTGDYLRLAGRNLRGLAPTRALAAWGGPARGPARHTWVTTELDALRRIARRHAVTINDVYLAALAGALRQWSLPEWRRPHRPIHALMPISIRTSAEQELMSNFTTGVRLALPCGEPDPGRRLVRVAALTRRLKRGGGLGVVERRHLALAELSPGASQRFLAHVASSGARTREVALVASNPGSLRCRLAVAGRPVTGLVGLPPLFVGRQHLSVGLFGYGEHARVTFTASASVPRQETLADLWLAELGELAELAARGSRR